MKGGTPAIDIRSTVRVNTVEEFKLKLFSVYKDLFEVVIKFNMVQKKRTKDTL